MRLGIDIGGTTINLGLADGGKLVKKVTVPSFPSDATEKQTFEYLESAIDSILVPEITNIGIGIPSVVDTERGIIYDAMNIPSWKEVHMAEELNSHYSLPVSINNDANCYALGAYSNLDGRKPHIMLCITLGTGVGVGVVCNGQILNGRNTGVGEISCVPYLDGTFDSYCSRQFFDSKGVTPKDTYIKAMAGDPEAIAIFDEFSDHLGKFLSLVMYAYDADLIVFGGGLANAFELFKDRMYESLDRNFMYKRSLANLEIMAMPNADLAIVGAAAL